MHEARRNPIEIILVGGGGHAKVLYSIIRYDLNFKVIGYTDTKKKEYFSELPYLGTDEFIFNSTVKNLVIGISYGKNIFSNLRKKVIGLFNESDYNFPNVFSKNSLISSEVNIKNGVQILHRAVINPDVEIGKFCIINTNAIVEHDVKLGDYVQVGPGSIILGETKIGNNCFIGSGAIVNDGLKICDNVIIGAGSVVTKNITEKGVYVGIPARRIRN